MTKRRKFLLTVVVGLGGAAVAFRLFWRPAAVWLMSRRTASEFRRDFSVQGATPGKLCLEEWAWRFGGRAGLPRLKALAKDPSLTPFGRAVAARLRDMVDNGTHLPYLRRIVQATRGQPSGVEPPPWPTSALIEYIYERDRD